MGRCLFASCDSDTRNTTIVFFKTPIRIDTNLAKLWFNRARRQDMSFGELKYNHMVCHKHFNRSQVEYKQYGKRFRPTIKLGELPLVNGERPTHPFTPSHTPAKVSAHVLIRLHI